MNWTKVAQLSLVHVGVSITVVPITSTLNRIMIVDLGFSALLVGVLVSLPYLLSPLQVVMGAWSDRHPLWGMHRSPWIVLGGLMAALGSYFTAHAAYLMADNFALGLLASLATFTVWGVGVNIASVSYLSLTSELGDEASGWRSRAVSVMWTAMILSTIFTSLAIARALTDFSTSALFGVFGIIWMISTLFVLLGAARIEPVVAGGRVVKHTADSPRQALRTMMGNPSAQRFFAYLVLVLISIHAQDVLLEPFGGEVLGMSVGATSRLTSIWGVGVFITLVGGIPIVRRWGKKPSANVGAMIASLGFALIIAAGYTQATTLFMGAVLVLGLGGGLMTVSNLSFMMDMVVPEAAGLYMGAWGVANFAGQALGAIVSGALRDITFWLTESAFLGYSLVFALEIAGLFLAVFLFREISVERFQREAEVTLADVLAVSAD